MQLCTAAAFRCLEAHILTRMQNVFWGRTGGKGGGGTEVAGGGAGALTLAGSSHTC